MHLSGTVSRQFGLPEQSFAWVAAVLAAVATIWRDPVLRPVAAALFALGAGIGSYAPYQSLIATGGLGIGNRAYAAVLVIASLVAAGGAVSIGILSDRRGNRRRLAAASAVSWLAGPVLMTFYPSQASFVLAHALFIPLGGTLFGQFFVLARIAAARHPATERAGIQASIRAAFAAPFILILPLWSVAIRAGAPLLAVYPVLGLAGTKLSDFHLFVSVTQVPIVSVNPNSPYTTFQQLLDAMKANPGITVATAGNTSSGHIAMEAIVKATGVSSGRSVRSSRASGSG